MKNLANSIFMSLAILMIVSMSSCTFSSTTPAIYTQGKDVTIHNEYEGFKSVETSYKGCDGKKHTYNKIVADGTKEFNDDVTLQGNQVTPSQVGLMPAPQVDWPVVSTLFWIGVVLACLALLYWLISKVRGCNNNSNNNFNNIPPNYNHQDNQNAQYFRPMQNYTRVTETNTNTNTKTTENVTYHPLGNGN